MKSWELKGYGAELTPHNESLFKQHDLLTTCARGGQKRTPLERNILFYD